VTIFHLKSKAGPDGKAHLGDVDVGVPNVDIDIVVSIPKRILTQEQWRAEMELVLAGMTDVHLEELPRKPYEDPWREE